MTRKNANLNISKKELRYQSVDPAVVFENGVPQPEPFQTNVDAYTLHVWAYACVRAIATNFASVGYRLWMKKKVKGEVTWVEDTANPILPLLDMPNPYMTGNDLRELAAVMLEITGNAYIAIETDKVTNKTELWPLPSPLVKIVTSRDRLIQKYVLEIDGKKIDYSPTEIIHVKNANPNSMLYGMGSITPLRLSLTQDFFAQSWNKFFFQNNARPDSVLEVEGRLDDAVRARMQRAWQKMYQGARNRGKTAILENGTKYREINRTQKEMEFVELRKMSREEILAGFGVPPVIVGIFEYANYANSKEQLSLFWRHNIVPRTTRFADALTLAIKRVPQFMDQRGSSFQADTSHIEALRPDELNRANTAKIYVDMGIPPNEVIDKLDLPFEQFDGGDESRPAGGSALPPIPGLGAGGVMKKDQDARRDIEWKRFDLLTRRLESEMLVATRSYFRSQKRRVVKALDEAAENLLAGVVGDKQMRRKEFEELTDEVFDFDAELGLMQLYSEEKIRKTYEALAKRTAARIRPGIDFELTDPKALAWITEKASKLARDANQYTREQITDGIADSVQQAVAEGFGQSETISQIADRIDEIYDFAAKGRSERIARTEVISASNAGSLQAMQELGAESKEWISSRDSKVRETHQRLDGQVVKVSEKFTSPSGVTLDFPGDPGADPAETVNCRCSVVPAESTQD